MKKKYLTPTQKVEKALKALKKAYKEQIKLDLMLEAMENEMISEIDAILRYDFKPSELRLMEENGLQFKEDRGVKFYNQMELEEYYDEKVYGTESEVNME